MTLRVSAAEPFTTSAVIRSCSVKVPAAANGVDVLSRAVRDGCIESYETSSFSGGTFLDCIDGICGTAGTYWRMTENGAMTSYGVDGFVAHPGDVLGFSYTIWAGCLADQSLC